MILALEQRPGADPVDRTGRRSGPGVVESARVRYRRHEFEGPREERPGTLEFVGNQLGRDECGESEFDSWWAVVGRGSGVLLDHAGPETVANVQEDVAYVSSVFQAGPPLG